MKIVITVLLLASSGWEPTSAFGFDFSPSSSRRLSLSDGSFFDGRSFQIDVPRIEFNSEDRQPEFDFEAPKIEFDRPEVKLDYDIKTPELKFGRSFDFEPREFEISKPEIKFEFPKPEFKSRKFDFQFRKPELDLEYEQPDIEERKPQFEFKAPELDFNIRKPEFKFDAPEIKFDAPEIKFGQSGLGLHTQYLKSLFGGSKSEDEQEAEESERPSLGPRFKVNLGEPEYEVEKPRVEVKFNEDFQPEFEYIKPKIRVQYDEPKIEPLRRTIQFSLADLGLSSSRRRSEE